MLTDHLSHFSDKALRQKDVKAALDDVQKKAEALARAYAEIEQATDGRMIAKPQNQAALDSITWQAKTVFRKTQTVRNEPKWHQLGFTIRSLCEIYATYVNHPQDFADLSYSPNVSPQDTRLFVHRLRIDFVREALKVAGIPYPNSRHDLDKLLPKNGT